MKNLVLELHNCIGYGFMAYLEDGVNRKVYDFLIDFGMWGGSTDTYKNYSRYELSEDCVKFMQTPLFKGFLVKNDVKLITSKDVEYKETLKLVYESD
jgi:hypothetical protein